MTSRQEAIGEDPHHASWMVATGHLGLKKALFVLFKLIWGVCIHQSSRGTASLKALHYQDCYQDRFTKIAETLYFMNQIHKTLSSEFISFLNQFISVPPIQMISLSCSLIKMWLNGIASVNWDLLKHTCVINFELHPTISAQSWRKLILS